jgi:hypothetical protein
MAVIHIEIYEKKCKVNRRSDSNHCRTEAYIPFRFKR